MFFTYCSDQETLLYLDSICFPNEAPLEFGPKCHYWVLLDFGIPVAYCGLKVSTEEVAYLNRAGVLPMARGQGYQRKMIRLREQYAASIGVEEVVTYTVIGNSHSSNNLIAAGYRLWDPEEEEKWVAEPVMYWYRALS